MGEYGSVKTRILAYFTQCFEDLLVDISKAFDYLLYDLTHW